jgi:broad-specificity NMP kinase
MTLKDTVIIAGFPGCGKSFLCKNRNDYTFSILDASSNRFERIVTDNGARINSLQYPNNYIEYIQSKIGKYDAILIDSSPDIQLCLINNNIDFVIVVPSHGITCSDYLARYKDRKYGIRKKFYNNYLIPNWDSIIDESTRMIEARKQFQLTKESPFLVNVFNTVIRSV